MTAPTLTRTHTSHCDAIRAARDLLLADLLDYPQTDTALTTELRAALGHLSLARSAAHQQCAH